MKTKTPTLNSMTKIGRFHYYGTPPGDMFADIGVINGKMVGAVFPVSAEIEKLIAKKPDIDPTDSERIECHIKRIVDSDYITAFADVVEKTFELDLEEWSQGYEYFWSPADHKHYRVVVLVPPKNVDPGIVPHIIANMERYHLKGGFDHFDVWPPGGGESYRRRA